MFKPTRNSIYQVYRAAQPYTMSFAYRGVFSDEVTASFVDLSESTITDFKGLPKVSKKVSFLLVESFQNIIRHAAMVRDEDGFHDDGVFCFRNDADSYIINSANYVRQAGVKPLITSVESVNEADNASLRSMYAERLANGSFSDKGGAGLGYIELARKSKQRIHYRLDAPVSDTPLFHQQVSYINRDGDKPQSYVDETEEVYRYMQDREMLILYKGDLSQKSIMPIVKILEINFNQNSELVKSKKRLIHLLVEMLQNARKHGAEFNGVKDGILNLYKQGGRHHLEIGNMIHGNSVEKLRAKLDEILKSSDSEIRDLHRKQMLSAADGVGGKSSGLGLMEIARFSMLKPTYSLERVNDNLSFFSLVASV